MMHNSSFVRTGEDEKQRKTQNKTEPQKERRMRRRRLVIIQIM
jgi:hypothetical protein